MQLGTGYARIMLIITLLTAAFGLQARGAAVTAPDSVRRNVFREVRGCVVDSLSGKPVRSALVSLTSGRKFAGHAATDSCGRFRLRWIARDSLRIEITHIGYLIKSLQPSGGGEELDIGTVRLSEDVKNIDEVVVKARMNIFTMRGDTVVFNPRAVKMMADDNAIDLLRRVPGIEINDGKITLMGEEVTATYVNGKRIYGSDNHKGMDFVKGREVTSIEFYDEVDTRTYEDTGEIVRRKVADIKTAEEFRRNIIYNAYGAAGTNLDANADGRLAVRYSSAANARSYTEAMQLELSGRTANTSNGGYGDGGKNRTTGATGSIAWNSGKRMVPMTLENGRKIEREVTVSNYRLHYDFGNSRSENLSAQRYIYNPSPDYTSKIYGDTTSSTNRNVSHRLSFNYFRNSKDPLLRSVGLTATTGSELRDQIRSAMLRTDDDISARTRSRDSGKGRSYGLSGNVLLSHRLSKRLTVSGNIRFNYSTNDNDGMRVDTSQTSSRRYELIIPLSRRSVTAGYSMSFNYKIGKEWFLKLSPSISYTDGKHKAVATDLLTAAIDSASTSRYVDGRLSHDLQAEIVKRRKKSSFAISGGYVLTQELRTEYFPDEKHKRETFLAPNANVSINLRGESKWSSWIMYNISSRPPSAEQLRDRLDTENPLWLTGGSPDLKSPVSNRFNVSAVRGDYGKGLMLNIGMGGSFTINDIATRSTTFDSDTYLPQYDYTALKGATLRSYANLNGNYSLSLNTGITVPLKSGSFRTGISLSRSVRPTISGTERIDVKNSGGTFSAGCDKLFFSKLNLHVHTATSLTRDNNGRMSYNTLNENLAVHVRCNPVERVFVSSEYILNFRCSSQPAVPIVRSNILNARLEIKLLRNRNLSVGGEIFDILGRRSSLFTVLEDTYVSETWQQTYSRYFLFSLRYEFNSKR